MELRHQLQTYGRYRGLFIGFVLLVTLATLALSWTAEPKYVASLSMTINRINRQETTEYQYDGYYAIQASDLFTQTLLSWFLTPSVLLEFYQKADLDPRISSINGLIGRFRARKFSAQNLVVQFSEADRSSAEKLAIAIGQVVKERGETLNQTSEHQGIFEIVPASPVVVQTKPNLALNTAAALAGSILLGIVMVAVIDSLRR